MNKQYKYWLKIKDSGFAIRTDHPRTDSVQGYICVVSTEEEANQVISDLEAGRKTLKEYGL